MEMLRRGLHSEDAGTRRSTARAIEHYKAVELRVDLEAVLKSDPSDDVRDEAANTLWLLKLRKSAPALRRAFDSGFRSGGVVYGLIQLGSDADIAAVLPLLKSEEEGFRRIVASGLRTATLVNSRPACDALLEALRDPSYEQRLDAVIALGHFREVRAIPRIRELLTHPPPPRPISWDDQRAIVDAVSAIGGPKAIALLDEMVQMKYRHHFGLEEALIHFGSPSSGRAIWKAYRKDPIRVSVGGDVTTIGDEDAIGVLAACADAELLQEIRERFTDTKDRDETEALGKLIVRIQARLKK